MSISVLRNFVNEEVSFQISLFKGLINIVLNSWAKMLELLCWLSENFEKTIAYIKKGYFRDKTKNDAERLMRKIKRIQQTHYFIRKLCLEN